ncbi:hypothetical protein D3C72_2251450 [compost metagenome]
MEYLPFASVCAPTLVPGIRIETAGIGRPSSAATTLPVITLFCENTGKVMARHSIISESNFRFISFKEINND